MVFDLHEYKRCCAWGQTARLASTLSKMNTEVRDAKDEEKQGSEKSIRGGQLLIDGEGELCKSSRELIRSRPRRGIGQEDLGPATPCHDQSRRCDREYPKA